MPEARQPGGRTSYKPAACLSTGPSTDMSGGEIKTWNTRVDIWPNLFRTRVQLPPPPPISEGANGTKNALRGLYSLMRLVFALSICPHGTMSVAGLYQIFPVITIILVENHLFLNKNGELSRIAAKVS